MNLNVKKVHAPLTPPLLLLLILMVDTAAQAKKSFRNLRQKQAKTLKTNSEI